MNCELFREQMSAYLDGELGPAEQAAFGSHLNACPACPDELDSLRRVVSLLTSIPAGPTPPDLTERIMAGLQETPQVAAPRPHALIRFPQAFSRFATVAAMFLAVVAVIVVIQRERSKGAAPVATTERLVRTTTQSDRTVRREVPASEEDASPAARPMKRLAAQPALAERAKAFKGAPGAERPAVVSKSAVPLAMKSPAKPAAAPPMPTAPKAGPADKLGAIRKDAERREEISPEIVRLQLAAAQPAKTAGSLRDALKKMGVATKMAESDKAGGVVLTMDLDRRGEAKLAALLDSYGARRRAAGRGMVVMPAARKQAPPAAKAEFAGAAPAEKESFAMADAASQNRKARRVGTDQVAAEGRAAPPAPAQVETGKKKRETTAMKEAEEGMRQANQAAMMQQTMEPERPATRRYVIVIVPTAKADADAKAQQAK